MKHLNVTGSKSPRIFGLIFASVLFATAPWANATQYDLTAAGSTAVINGALFSNTDQQPAGTGVFDSFLRVQANGFEQGYNTDGGFPFDDKNPHNFQHSLLLSSLDTSTISSVTYYRFTLDANQTGGSNFSLDQLQFYTSNNPSQTTQTFNADGTLPLGTLAYNLNPGAGTGQNGGSTANNIITTSTGSGKADLYAFIPVSFFNQSDRYVYLYFASGDHTLKPNDGFEEWGAEINAVPEPSTLALVLMASAFAGIGACFRHWRKRVRLKG